MGSFSLGRSNKTSDSSRNASQKQKTKSSRKKNLNASNLMMRQDMYLSSDSSGSEDENETFQRIRSKQRCQLMNNSCNQIGGLFTAPTDASSHIYSQTTLQQNRVPRVNYHTAGQNSWSSQLHLPATGFTSQVEMPNSRNRNLCSDITHQQLAFECRRLTKDSQQLIQENERLRRDIDTLFKELEFTTEVVQRCARYIPHLIDILFQSSIGKRTLSHLNPSHIFRSDWKISAKNNGSDVLSSKNEQNKESSQHDVSKSFIADNFLPDSNSSINLEDFLEEVYQTVKPKTKKRGTSSGRKHRSSSRSRRRAQESNYENLAALRKEWGYRSEKCSVLSRDTNHTTKFEEPLTGEFDTTFLPGPSQEPDNSSSSKDASLSKSGTSNDDEESQYENAGEIDKKALAPFFEENADLALENISKESKQTLNETFSEPESNSPAVRNSKTVKTSGTLQTKENSFENEPSTSRNDQLRVDLSKTTLEKVKSNFISSFRQQIKRSSNSSVPNKTLNVSCGQLDFEGLNLSSINAPISRNNALNEFSAKASQDFNGNLRSEPPFLHLHSASSVDILPNSKLFSKKLIHLQSKDSVVPSKLQELLKQEPIAQLIKSLNELEAVIKIHVNSVYLKYII